jgi:hypothetical protein
MQSTTLEATLLSIEQRFDKTEHVPRHVEEVSEVQQEQGYHSRSPEGSKNSSPLIINYDGMLIKI